jgi:steroid 5-alpha reductase family enzyme
LDLRITVGKRKQTNAVTPEVNVLSSRDVLRTKLSPFLFFIFNVLFISLAQSVLLFMITMPTYILLLAARFTGDEFSKADLICSRVLMGLVLLEFFADQQQWNFQQAKKEYQKTAKVPNKFEAEDLDRGFVVTGLWSWSRHPNFAAEQGMFSLQCGIKKPYADMKTAVWCTLYQWSCATTDTIYNWTIIGAISYCILFQASTWFTELITSGKYPEYVEYQKVVGKFIPKIFGSPLVDDAAPVKVAAKKAVKGGKNTLKQ